MINERGAGSGETFLVMYSFQQLLDRECPYLVI
jgi:hypothetical protein